MAVPMRMAIAGCLFALGSHVNLLHRALPHLGAEADTIRDIVHRSEHEGTSIIFRHLFDLSA